jgi:hypothetical protein
MGGTTRAVAQMATPRDKGGETTGVAIVYRRGEPLCE